MKESACRGVAFKIDPGKDPFFPGRGETPQVAISEFCFSCTVKPECNSYADRKNVKTGVWGGVRRTRENVSEPE